MQIKIQNSKTKIQKKSFYLHTLGCKVNWCDSESIAAYAEKEGWNRVEKVSNAQVCVINTCTVTKHADASARKIIRRIYRENPDIYIIVTGCYAKTDREILLKLEEVDEVIFPGDDKNLVKRMDFGATQFLSKTFKKTAKSEENHQKTEKFFSRTRIFIKVQDGCNQFCAYCKVPYARGRTISVPVEEVLKKVEKISTSRSGRSAVKEIVVTGIHLAAYEDKNKDLADLIEEIAKKTSIRIRIGSLEANAVTKKLCELFKKYPKIMPQLHIPLQSGSDRILELMNRPVRVSDFNRATDLFLSSHPLATVSTDVLVGLPGETEEDFEETVKIIEKFKFLKVHIFQFSPRPGTAAAKMEKLFVQPSEIKRREKILIEKANISAQLCRNKFENSKLKVLIEEKKEGYWEGFSENYIRVKTSAEIDCRNNSVEHNSIVILNMSNPENIWE